MGKVVKVIGIILICFGVMGTILVGLEGSILDALPAGIFFFSIGFVIFVLGKKLQISRQIKQEQRRAEQVSDFCADPIQTEILDKCSRNEDVDEEMEVTPTMLHDIEESDKDQWLEPIEETFPSNDISNRNFYMVDDYEDTENVAETLDVHPDVAPLLWIGSGPCKNYHHQKYDASTIHANGYSIHVAFNETEEPSLLYPELKICMPNDDYYVERPPYYPRYTELTSKQKGHYWKFLKDPYNPRNDIGYVFIFYYGLERHLLEGSKIPAFNMILRLRDIYANSSFQYYSACAIMLFCMAEKRMDLAYNFIKSLDKEHEQNISSNFYIFFKYAIGLNLTCQEIINHCKAFGFTNTRYIKNNSDKFLKNLQDNLKKIYGQETLDLSIFFSEVDLSRFPTKFECGCANFSIENREIAIPAITEHPQFKKEMFDLLSKTHEDTKHELAEERKKSNAGSPSKKKTIIDPIKEIRKYKELFDEGIITEEEFNAKKKELL